MATVKPAAKTIDPTLKAELVTLHARLNPAPNYLEVFGFSAEKMPTENEVRILHGEMVKKFHPDTMFQFDDPELTSMSEVIFRVVQEAYEALNTQQKIIEYKEKLARGEEHGGRNERLRRDMQGIVAFEQGLKLVQQKQWQLAVNHFRLALDINPSDPDRMAYYGWALFNLAVELQGAPTEKAFRLDETPGELQYKAREILSQALENNKKLASKAHLFLGHIYKHQGLPELAEQQYHLALICSPGLSEAVRALREISQEKTKVTQRIAREKRSTITKIFDAIDGLVRKIFPPAKKQPVFKNPTIKVAKKKGA